MESNTDVKTVKQQKKAAGCVLAAGMLWGCMGILVRSMNRMGFNSLEITAFRAIVTTLVMFAGLLLYNKKELVIRRKDIWCFLGTGLASVTFFNVCYFTCMNYTTLSIAAILLYTAPSFVIVMSFFLFKEKLNKRKFVALLLAFLGCVLVSGGFQGEGISILGLLTGLGAGFGYALYSIFSRYALQRGYSSYTITAYTFLFAAIGTMFVVDKRHFAECAMQGSSEMIFTGFMAFMTTVVAYLLYTAGLKNLENGKASILASIEPVMASLVGFLLYKEAMQPLGVGGMILVLVSCFLVS